MSLHTKLKNVSCRMVCREAMDSLRMKKTLETVLVWKLIEMEARRLPIILHSGVLDQDLPMELDQFRFLLDSIRHSLLHPARAQDQMAASQGLPPLKRVLQYHPPIPTHQEPPSATERTTVELVGMVKVGLGQVLAECFQSHRVQSAHFPCQSFGAPLHILN